MSNINVIAPTLALVMGCALSSGSIAGTFEVNTQLDGIDANLADNICDAGGGQCTLRAAVMQANALAAQGPHQINLPAGTYLLSGVLADDNENQDSVGDLDLKASLTIMGAGVADTVIQGQGSTRLFQVHNDPDQVMALTLRKLSLQNGNVVGRDGGALLF